MSSPENPIRSNHNLVNYPPREYLGGRAVADNPDRNLVVCQLERCQSCTLQQWPSLSRDHTDLLSLLDSCPDNGKRGPIADRCERSSITVSENSVTIFQKRCTVFPDLPSRLQLLTHNLLSLLLQPLV